ncbi:MAG: hypothetical protein AAGN82_19290 [Myxococcota bacterium]
MTLIEFVQKLDEADDAHVIYASPRWRPESRVYVGPEPFDGSLPRPARGMTYLVSVEEAKRVFRGCRPGATAHDVAKSVVYFGIYDCAEPVALAV